MEGYINIFKNDNFLNANGGIYDAEDKAIESGKLIRGYITTIKIDIPEGAINGK